MADFITNATTDSGTINFPKFDQIQLPPGTNAVNIVSGSEWNSVCQALFDIRTGIISGSFFGFGKRFASIGAISQPPGIGNLATVDLLYVNADGALVQHKRDGSEFIIAAAAANVQYSQYAELDTLPTPVILPALTQGSGIIYFRSNGSTTPGQRRTQLVVRWGTDNSDTVIAEGPLR